MLTSLVRSRRLALRPLAWALDVVVALWVTVFIQENPKDEKNCLAEVRSHVFGGDRGWQRVSDVPDTTIQFGETDPV